MYSTSTSQSQTSADDDFINEFGRSCSCSTLTDTTFGVSTGCCAKDVIENLMVQLKEKDVQLKEKDAQLKEKDEQIKNLFSLIRPVAATPGTDELKTELAIANKVNSDFQMKFWKSFPSPRLSYHIKAPSGNGGYVHLYAHNSGFLCLSDHDHPKGHFKFAKYSDGNFSITQKPMRQLNDMPYTLDRQQFLQYLHESTSKPVILHPSDQIGLLMENSQGRESKVKLYFHLQQDKQLPGILVDIFSLASRCFLSPVVNRCWASREANQQNRLMATSPTPPANKFMILAEGME